MNILVHGVGGSEAAQDALRIVLSGTRKNLDEVFVADTDNFRGQDLQAVAQRFVLQELSRTPNKEKKCSVMATPLRLISSEAEVWEDAFNAALKDGKFSLVILGGCEPIPDEFQAKVRIFLGRIKGHAWDRCSLIVIGHNNISPGLVEGMSLDWPAQYLTLIGQKYRAPATDIRLVLYKAIKVSMPNLPPLLPQ